MTTARHQLLLPPSTLRQLRSGLALTQVELAARLGVSPASVHRWERSGRAGDRDTLVRLALAGLYAVLWREHLARIAALAAHGAALREHSARVEAGRRGGLATAARRAGLDSTAAPVLPSALPSTEQQTGETSQHE